MRTGIRTMAYCLHSNIYTCYSFILDGVPISRKLTEIMASRGLVPVRVIDLQLSSHEVVTRATKDRYSPDHVLSLHDSAQILTVKLAAWHKEVRQKACIVFNPRFVLVVLVYSESVLIS